MYLPKPAKTPTVNAANDKNAENVAMAATVNSGRCAHSTSAPRAIKYIQSTHMHRSNESYMTLPKCIICVSLVELTALRRKTLVTIRTFKLVH